MASDVEKPPKRMTCWNCPRYSRTERRCAVGKSNPKRKSDSVAVAEALGVTALCHFSPYREPLAMRMYFPADPATIQASARRRKRSRARDAGEAAAPESIDATDSAVSATRGDA
jgi:hypothetical protein